uniref:Reverse transcriptase domain-containing protein n=1 Tax=Tanacetum cinerariifolium TaxID=118510 RepID=A0A6L2MC75_TANCI|nr:reverse transcriptase domain-containing protein [Tanacetum cinerariifolium]
MSAMANVTPIIATVKNASVKEKTLKETDVVPKASILDFCEEHYEDILPIIFDRASHDKRKEVQTRLDFGESPKKRDGETIEEFMERFKIETEHMKGVLECMRIFRFMHRVNNPELIKRLNEHVPKTVEEMMTATTAFIRGEIAAASKKKVHTPLKSQDHQRMGGVQQVYPLTRTAKEIFAAESRKFKPPLPMIEEMARAGKLSHFIKEIRQDKHQYKTRKKDASVKDKAVAIYMIQPWQRVMQQKVTQSFTCIKETTFPPLTTNKGTEGPLVIEAEIGGHAVHCVYVDGGSLIELMLLVTIGDAEHYTKAWMNFMIVRSPSPYNGIIGRPRIREIKAVPSTAHEMLKFSVNGEIVTIRSTILTLTECATIAATPKDSTKMADVRHKNFKVAIHPDFSDQEITIGGTSINSTSEKDIPLSDRKKRACPGTRQGNPSKGTKTGRGRNSTRSLLPRLVIQPGHGKKARCSRRNVSRIHDQSRRDKTVPIQNGGRVATPIPTDNQRGQKPEQRLRQFSISQVPRSKNKKADALSQIASTNSTHLSKQVLVEVLKEKSIYEREMATVVAEEGPTWMTSIIEYLRDETLPDNRKEARKLRIKARQYKLLEGILYRRSFLKPWLR